MQNAHTRTTLAWYERGMCARSAAACQSSELRTWTSFIFGEVATAPRPAALEPINAFTWPTPSGKAESSKLLCFFYSQVPMNNIPPCDACSQPTFKSYYLVKRCAPSPTVMQRGL